MEKFLRQHLPGGKFKNVSVGRSKAMGAVRGRGNKTTELQLRLALVRAGIKGWRMHPSGVQGKPDVYFPRSKVAIFADGCFWHGCEKCGHFPRKNPSFWRAKIERNRARDGKTTAELETQGVRVLRFWEHELQEDLAGCVTRVQRSRINNRKKGVSRLI